MSSINNKCAILDYDGTLSRLRHGWPEYMREFFDLKAFPNGFDFYQSTSTQRECSIKIDHFIEHAAGTHIEEQIAFLKAILSELKLIELDTDSLTNEYIDFNNNWVQKRLEQHKATHTLDELLLRDAKVLLKDLSELNYELYLLSGTGQTDLQNECDFLKISHFFKEIIGFSTGVPEPFKPKVIETILNTQAYSADQCLVIGDGLVELEAGREHHCTCINIAINEEQGYGLDTHKSEIQKNAGFHLLLSDLTQINQLL